MKKVLLLSLISIILMAGLIVLTGCETATGDIEEQGSKTETAKAVDKIEVNGVQILLNKEDKLKELSYKHSDDLKYDDYVYARYYTYANKDIYDGEFVFRIVVMYQENTTVESVIKNTTYKLDSKKTINGSEWEKYVADTGAIEYMYQKDTTVYAVMVEPHEGAIVDLNTISDAFMSNVKF